MKQMACRSVTRIASLSLLIAAAPLALNVSAADGSVTATEIVPVKAGDVAEEKRAVRSWLNRMADAVQRLNYTGTYVYFHDDKLDAMQIVHAMTAEGEYEKLVSLTGDGREIHRTRRGVQCYLPSEQTVMMDEAGPRSPFRLAKMWDVDQLEAVYEFRYAGNDRVAGRACKRIHVLPRDQYRFGYKLCLDSETGMLLSTELVNQNGVTIEQMMFTEVAFPLLIPQTRLAPEVDTEGYVWLKHGGPLPKYTSQTEAETQWQLKEMPPGFHASGGRSKNGALDQDLSWQMAYTDGLASVSIFVEPLQDGQAPLEGGSRIGAVMAWGSVREGHQITVMGDVPGHTLRSFAAALEPRPREEAPATQSVEEQS